MDDNLEIAMHQLAEHLPLTVTRSTGAAPGEGTVQVLIRATGASRDRWKAAAALLGVSMAEYVRQLCDARAAELLDCPHPVEAVTHNRWGAGCSRCGQQLSVRRGAVLGG